MTASLASPENLPFYHCMHDLKQYRTLVWTYFRVGKVARPCVEKSCSKVLSEIHSS